jgi:Zn-dependent peptidase ImmA (M78 family)
MTLKAFINKQTLQSICKHLNVTPSFLQSKSECAKLSIVDKWLNPDLDTLPTFNQAKKIATSLKIPFAGLYMNDDQIPLKNLPKFVEYRTLPDSLTRDESALNIAIFDLLNFRDLFISLKDELGEQITQFNVNIKDNLNPVDMANQIRLKFDIDLQEQFKNKSKRQLYLYIRNKIEIKCIFIQCFTNVNIEKARGLAIFDNNIPTIPIIGINDSDSYAAKSFTIIHELVHIINQQSACCNDFFKSFTTNEVEIFNNAVAGEFLVPRIELENQLKNYKQNEPLIVDDIKNLNKKFHVSTEVILRRLLDCKKINRSEYKNFLDCFQQEIEANKQKQKQQRETGLQSSYGKPAHLSAFDRISSQLSQTFVRGLNRELLTKVDISQYLGISQKNTELFLSQLSHIEIN